MVALLDANALTPDGHGSVVTERFPKDVVERAFFQYLLERRDLVVSFTVRPQVVGELNVGAGPVGVGSPVPAQAVAAFPEPQVAEGRPGGSSSVRTQM